MAGSNGRFGSDKPDMRFGMELHDVSDVVKDCGFGVFKNALEEWWNCSWYQCKGQGGMPRKKIDKLVDLQKIMVQKDLLILQFMKMEQ